MTRARRWTLLGAPLAIPIVCGGLSLATITPQVLAQGSGEAPHPAHIHSGTCAELGDIVVPLSDVKALTAGEVFGAPSAVPVEESVTEANMTLSDILAAPHAVNIHESKEAIQVYIACGDIGGRVVDGQLSIGLQEINGSGYNGVAILDTAGDKTDVTVYLADQGASGEAEQAAAPAAATDTPAAAQPTSEAPAAPVATEGPTAAPAETAAPASEEVPVDIREFEFIPPTIEIAAGDTVTWTNQGAIPHTATAEQRDVLQSGAIAPGSSFSKVFNEPGEFAYFCEFHPNMTGTIVVK